MKKNKPLPAQGWQCPVCGAVWSLTMYGCEICNEYARIRAEQQNVRNMTTTDTITLTEYEKK